MLCRISGSRGLSAENGPPGARCGSTSDSVTISSRVRTLSSTRRRMYRGMRSAPLVLENIHVAREIAVHDVRAPALHVRLDQVPRGVIVEGYIGRISVQYLLGLLEQAVARAVVRIPGDALEQRIEARIRVAAIVEGAAALEQLHEIHRVGEVADPGIEEQ